MKKGTKRTLKSRLFTDNTIGFKSIIDKLRYSRHETISLKKIRSGTRYVSCHSSFNVGFADEIFFSKRVEISISKRVEEYFIERDQLGDKGGICSLSSMSLNSIQKIKPLKSM